MSEIAELLNLEIKEIHNLLTLKGVSIPHNQRDLGDVIACRLADKQRQINELKELILEIKK